MLETLGMVIFSLVLWGLVSLLSAAFWLWMLIECATKERNEGNDKIVWILIIVLAPMLGATVYFFFRRPKRMAELGR